MFPLNLQRNIVQLDKQISLLENECKNMEIDKKRKNQKFESTYSSCSRSLNTRIKAPTVKVNVKKSDNLKITKKATPPASTRVQGTSPYRCSKNWSENGNTLLEKKGKSSGISTKTAVCSCHDCSECNLKSEKKCTKHVCCNAVTVADLSNESMGLKRKDHVLCFPNVGGTIEVTVTQKPLGKENSPKCHSSSLRKSVNSEREVSSDLDGCRCHIKGQKWSEILSLDSSRNRHADEGKKVSQSQNLNNKKQLELNVSQNEDSGIKEETFEIPIKLPSQLEKTKSQSDTNSNKFDKKINSSLEKFNEDARKDLKDSIQLFQLLLTQFQNMSGDHLKNSPMNTTSYMKIKDGKSEESEADKVNIFSGLSAENTASYLNTMKHHCEILVKEKSFLTEELEAKDRAIAAMKEREEEYLSLINTLKDNLDKAKCNAQEGVEKAKEMNVLKNTFIEQMKVSKTLRKCLFVVQKSLEQYSLENDTLKTQIKILKLEAQKHEVLLAGKDAEINKYREEIQNFQRQISEHLSTLKSNSQAVDVEKMMEAIMQQSQIFAQTDIDSLEKDGKDSSKGQNILMHSSPTSTKTSDVNSSWKQISSISGHNESKTGSVIFLNEDKNEKNFFDIFGGNIDSGCPVGMKKLSSSKNLLEKEDVKYSSSFTSCVSSHEEDNHSVSSQDSLISKDTTINEDGLRGEHLERASGVSSDKAQSNIDELLKIMKLKFSKEIFNNSFPSCTVGDYLETSQISSISPL